MDRYPIPFIALSLLAYLRDSGAIPGPSHACILEAAMVMLAAIELAWYSDF